jgi:hypothetical protein
MKMYALAAAAITFVLATFSPASARPYEPGTWGLSSSQDAPITRNKAKKGRAYAAERRAYRAASSGSYGGRRYGGVGPRPARWCGWWMRTQKGGGPQYNLAWNWRHYGRPGSPQIGAVVVWRHHVGIITGRAANGQWIVTSGNDGGRVRSRARSIAGAIIRV